MSNSLLHIEKLKVFLLVGDDDVDVVGASQAVVTDREQAIRIRWQIDSNDFWALVRDNIEEARVLMGETIVILPPDSRSK
jgi:hypothetical protein